MVVVVVVVVVVVGGGGDGVNSSKISRYDADYTILETRY